MKIRATLLLLALAACTPETTGDGSSSETIGETGLEVCPDNAPGHPEGVAWGPCCLSACDFASCAVDPLGDVCVPDECGPLETMLDAAGRVVVFEPTDECMIPCGDACPLGMICDGQLGGCVW